MDFASSQLATASSYSAYQIGDEVVLVARGNRRPEQVVTLDYTVHGDTAEFSLSELPVAESVSPPFQYFTAFRSMQSGGRIRHLRLRDKTGVREIAVVPKPGGIIEGGADLELPLVSSALPILDVIGRMKARDVRAVAVTYTPVDHRVFLNYQIAAALLTDASLFDIHDQGHRVGIVASLRQPFARRQLFSMTQPAGPDTAHLVSLFEEVGNAVAIATKICLCSSRNGRHNRLDSVPTLDGTGCPVFPPGHGTLNCF